MTEQRLPTHHDSQRSADRPSAPASVAQSYGFEFRPQILALLATDGTVLEANRTSLGTVGFPDDAMAGHPFVEAGWPQRERVQLQADLARAAQGEPVRREIELIDASGRSTLLDFTLEPVRNPATGEVTLVIAEGRDVTLLPSFAAKLAQLQKMQALGELASGIAHDFNNILQSITGAADLIELRTEEDKVRKHIRTILGAAERGSSITRRLLSFSHRSEPRVEQIDAAELLDSVREVFAHTLGPAIRVLAEVPAGLPPLSADRGQVETALVNLGTNARDAMPGGGILTLSAEAVRDHPAAPAPGDYVRISVTDTGIGMAAATLARAREPFFTTKPPGEGTGLGLSMVGDFCEQSGGAMTIDTAPGTGTTVSLWLRSAMPETAPGPGKASDAVRADPGGAHVLLVDDDFAVREILADHLEESGFAVLTAASGVEALALIEGGERVDVLVCDLSMPKLNGVETIRQARALRPDLPCLLLTGYVGERAALSAEGAFSVIRKPVKGEALAELITASLKRL